MSTLLASCVATGLVAGGAVLTSLHPARAQSQQADLEALQERAKHLSEKISLLEDENAVENLQRTYGYFVDKALYSEIAKLFAKDGTLEIGGRGIFVGPERVHEYMTFLSDEGPAYGLLMNHLQLQPVIHVAPDGKTAKGRWRFMAMGGEKSEDAGKEGLPSFGYLGEGDYENEYVKEDGVWKIKRLWGVFRMYTQDTEGWGKVALPLTHPEDKLPPDQPPTLLYEMYPGTYIPPFHYDNPVTGRPVTME
jgi:hypothetical protein